MNCETDSVYLTTRDNYNMPNERGRNKKLHIFCTTNKRCEVINFI